MKTINGQLQHLENLIIMLTIWNPDVWKTQIGPDPIHMSLYYLLEWHGNTETLKSVENNKRNNQLWKHNDKEPKVGGIQMETLSIISKYI